jgi:hypothetical protein
VDETMTDEEARRLASDSIGYLLAHGMSRHADAVVSVLAALARERERGERLEKAIAEFRAAWDDYKDDDGIVSPHEHAGVNRAIDGLFSLALAPAPQAGQKGGWGVSEIVMAWCDRCREPHGFGFDCVGAPAERPTCRITTRKCRVCGERPVCVPDRTRLTLRPEVCHACHQERLRGDLRKIFTPTPPAPEPQEAD